MLPGAEGVDKFDVDHLGAALLGILNYALGCAHVCGLGLAAVQSVAFATARKNSNQRAFRGRKASAHLAAMLRSVG